MKPWFRKSNGTNFCLVPDMKITSIKRKLTSACRFLINVKCYGCVIVGIQGINFISAGYLDIYNIIKPLVIFCPSDIELIYFRYVVIFYVIEIGKVFCIGNVCTFVFSEFPFIGRCMRTLMTRVCIESATTAVFSL